VCPRKALSTSVQGRPAIPRGKLVIEGGFAVPKSWWAKK
jgi:hypothetical protein